MRPEEGASTLGGNESRVFVHPQTAGSDLPYSLDNHGSDDGFSDERCCMCLMVMMWDFIYTSYLYFWS